MSPGISVYVQSARQFLQVKTHFAFVPIVEVYKSHYLLRISNTLLRFLCTYRTFACDIRGLKKTYAVRYILENFVVPVFSIQGWFMEPIYLWQAAYMAAVCETDDEQMSGKILEALAALEQRLLSPAEIDTEELKAIQKAQDSLQDLKAERVKKLDGSVHQPDLLLPLS